MQQVSPLLERLTESATLAMARKSRELQAQGIAVINLSLGEPDFDTPAFIQEAAVAAIRNNYSHYPPVNGYESLRNAICTKMERDNGLKYTAGQIVVSTGAKQTLMNIVLSLVGPGDEVVLPAPYWVSYIEMVKLSGATPVVLETDIASDFKISPAQLKQSLTEKSRLFIFSSPCNPSGTVYSKAELDALAEVLSAHPRLIAVSDEIYEHINFTGEHYSLANCAGMYEKTVTVNGMSKGFAMTGWRIGYMCGPQWIAQACTKLQGQFTSGANTIAQKASEAALQARPDVVYGMRDIFKKRRDLLIDALSPIAGMVLNTPPGAFYLFPDVSAFFGKQTGNTQINNADDMCEYLLGEAHVALVSGGAFGAPNCIRFSYAAAEADLLEAARRVQTALEKLS